LIRDEILSKEMPTTVRYSAENSQRVYAELLSRVSDELAARRIVVIEGTFTSSRGRRQFAQIAQSLNATAILVWTDCPSEKIKEHLQARSSAGQLFGSEATADVSARQRAVFETPESSELFDAICRIDTAQELTRAQETTWARVCECLSTKSI
jgi:predicted kinase